jgi:hypothetical protein
MIWDLWLKEYFCYIFVIHFSPAMLDVVNNTNMADEYVEEGPFHGLFVRQFESSEGLPVEVSKYAIVCSCSRKPRATSPSRTIIERMRRCRMRRAKT